MRLLPRWQPRWLFLAVLVPLAAPAVGCSRSSTPAPGGAAAPAGGPKVALLLSTLQEERYKKDQRYFEDAARKLRLQPFTLAADNDNARQLGQIEDALARGAKVLVVQPTDSAAAGAYVERAHAAGAKIVAYDRAIKSGAADYYVAHDSYRVGVLSAEAAVKATGGKGAYVLLHGQSGHSVVADISRGYHDVLKPYVDKGEIQIVMEKYHDAWSPEQSLKSVEDVLSQRKGAVAAILANNSGLARGAVQAVQAAGLKDKGIFIAGSDADAANINYLCQGQQSVEVLKEIKPLAEKAAEVAAALATGQAPAAEPGAAGAASATGVPTAHVAVHLVTRDNAWPLLVDSGFHDAAALPACKR